MITITRSTARLVRAVFRRALGFTARGRGSILLVEAGPEGLAFKSRNFNVAAEYRIAGECAAETLTMPFELLQDCEGSKDQPVELKLCGKSVIDAQWSDGAIPQVKQYDAHKSADLLKDFPTIPEILTENPHGLLSALKDAAETADQTAVRYATNMIQLRGSSGSLGATDGHHLLVQRGFTFPWTDDLLIPASKMFGAQELSGDEPIFVGRSDNWITLRTGPWTFHFSIGKEGRFPKLDDNIRPTEVVPTRLQLSADDAVFLEPALGLLPCHDENHFPVTLELNGQILVRAKALDQSRVTELSLNGSTCIGDATVLNTNRKYLARAIRMGFREVLVYDNNKPVQCQDEHRSYVWALLDPEGAIKPGIDPIRIQSPSRDAAVAGNQSHQERNTTTMPRSKTSDYGHAPTGDEANGTTNGGAAEVSRNVSGHGATNGEHASDASLIEQAETVRTSLRESADKVGDLIAALKRQRKQSRLMRSTLSSLRQLQTLDA
ncbi:MAG: hypothetical protein K8T91_10815 [Planctomycetes bacterium]|nr:hypothetical protein [Planctomycetota bacterium]